MKNTYTSKVDSWLAIVLLASAVISLVAGYSVLSQGGGGSISIALFTVVVGAGLPLWLLVDTRYVLDEQHLRIRSGPFRWQIPYREIRKVEASRSGASGPALSLDRLRIDYGVGRSCLISPADRERFVAALESQL